MWTLYFSISDKGAKHSETLTNIPSSLPSRLDLNCRFTKKCPMLLSLFVCLSHWFPIYLLEHVWTVPFLCITQSLYHTQTLCCPNLLIESLSLFFFFCLPEMVWLLSMLHQLQCTLSHTQLHNFIFCQSINIHLHSDRWVTVRSFRSLLNLGRDPFYIVE